jgi:hypothetical protein
MDQKTCTLFSGGLKGAEATFGEAAEKYGLKEIIYTFEGHKLNRNKNSVILSKEELERGDISMELASRMLNRTYYETEKIRKVLQTIFHMVNNGHQVFVIGTIMEDNSVKGGTGWAVELAKLFNRPLHVFDQPKKQWFSWKEGGWKEDTPLIEYDTFVGSGTRYLSDAGREAIEKLFADSCDQAKKNSP